MAITANTTTVYDVTGNREDLADVISMLPTIDYPFYTGCGAGKKPISTKVEWQIDAIPSADSNAALEGDVQGTLIDLAATTRAYNYTQIQKKEFAVSRTQDEVQHAGTTSESDHQTLKNTKAIMGDFEYAFLREVYASTEAGSTTVARKMKGALNWCTTNVEKASDATVAADGTITGGTARNLDELIIKNLCQDIFTAGGNPKIAYCGPWQKMQISALQGTANYRTAVEAKKLNATVDVYVNDFFEIRVIPHRTMPTDVFFMPDMAFWKKRIMTALHKTNLSSTADGKTYRLLAEHTLESTNEAASGRAVNLSTS